MAVMVRQAKHPKALKFDPGAFLATIGEGKLDLAFAKNIVIFAQGDVADSLFYIQKGVVKITVLSSSGREATLGLLAPKDFFGEGALAGQQLRRGSASAMTDCEVLRLDKYVVIAAIKSDFGFAELFIAYLLARNLRYEEDLIDQLFNSSEKPLARVLLILAHFGEERAPATIIPRITQESLAEMIGTTRSRVSFFMNRFRKLGYVSYSGGAGGGLQVHNSLREVVSHE